MAVSLLDLWLPILLSGLACYMISAICWMVLPHHKPEWSGLPDEDALMALLSEQKAGRGHYSFPHCSSNEQMRDPEFSKKWTDGPSGFLIVQGPENKSMGKNMAMSFSYNLAVAVVVAYLATIGLEAGAAGTDVFRMTATATFLGCWAAHVPNAIWFSFTWSSAFKQAIDALLYALATGGIFVAFWPDGLIGG